MFTWFGIFIDTLFGRSDPFRHLKEVKQKDRIALKKIFERQGFSSTIVDTLGDDEVAFNLDWYRSLGKGRIGD